MKTETKTQHTPGPWLRDGRTVYALEHDGWYKGVERFRNRFYAGVQRVPGVPEEELEANAHLIAAAPELLEALKKLVASPVVDGISPAIRNEARQRNAPCPFQQAIAAIAKATGETK